MRLTLRTYCIFSTVVPASSRYLGAHHPGQTEENRGCWGQSRNRPGAQGLGSSHICVVSLYDLEEPFISRFSDVTVLLFFFLSVNFVPPKVWQNFQ